MSFKFGLNVKNKASVGLAKAAPKPALAKKKKPLFDDDADDVADSAKAQDGAQEIGEFNFEDTLPAASEPSKPAGPKVKKGQPPTEPPKRKPKVLQDDPTSLENSASAKEAERRAQEALKADSTIYDYDVAYEALHAVTAARKAAEQQDPTLSRRPKYMESLFESAEQRKKDQLRAKDKLLQREREAEGDEFADKEKFVTGAYKAAQEEARKAEEEEQLRQCAEEAKRQKFGMQGFHKQMLAEQEARHQEAVQAAALAAQAGFKAPPAATETQKTDAQIVAQLRAQGKSILLNDDGHVADKRQLLSAGLNIVAKPRPHVTQGSAATRAPGSAAAAAPYQPPASGRNAQRERQTALVAQQIEAAAKRKADEEAQELAKVLHAAKSRKTEGEVLSARERYLKRKREKEEAKK